MSLVTADAVTVDGKAYALSYTLKGTGPSRVVKKACTRIFKTLGKPDKAVDVTMNVNGAPYTAVYEPLTTPKVVQKGGTTFTITHECSKVSSNR
jgi:hypothetical protein